MGKDEPKNFCLLSSLKVDMPPLTYCKPSLLKPFTGPNADETGYLLNQNGVPAFQVTVVLFLYQYYLLKVLCDYGFLL